MELIEGESQEGVSVVQSEGKDLLCCWRPRCACAREKKPGDRNAVGPCVIGFVPLVWAWTFGLTSWPASGLGLTCCWGLELGSYGP